MKGKKYSLKGLITKGFFWKTQNLPEILGKVCSQKGSFERPKLARDSWESLLTKGSYEVFWYRLNYNKSHWKKKKIEYSLSLEGVSFAFGLLFWLNLFEIFTYWAFES